ncbi:MAG: transposase [Desulfobacterales bacterium]|nr:MAG: transposase [Desulfobacterales bacterium]
MARPLRVEYPGAVYHVINRGNAGEKLFKNDRDREKFLVYLEKAVERFSLKIHAYCLMKNHFHILLETPLPNLSQSIQWINVSYAGYFNRKHHRSGHLFQGRFKSILVDADEYLKQLSRYIHLNPVRAKIVQRPDEYQWSSYPAFVGKTKQPEWMETDWLLSQFGTKKKHAVKNYKNFVENVDIQSLENPAKDLAGGFILGNPDFVNWIKETFLSNQSGEKEIPQLRKLKPKTDIDKIIRVVGSEFDCETKAILRKGLKRNMARDVAIFLARELTGETGKRIGEYFGNISGASVTTRYNYLAKQIKENKRLRTQINRVRNEIINN